ncbi:MAG: hypothetical protein ACRELC_13260, partial [Gemmatimonadota bacterium]
RWVRSRFGRPPHRAEVHRPRPVSRLLELRDWLISSTERLGRLSAALLQKESWDLALVCFTATHRGGHKLWSETGVTGGATPSEHREFAGALHAVYRSIDAEVGRLVEVSGAPDPVLAFSLHGMGSNTSRADLMERMMANVLSPDAGGRSQSSPAAEGRSGSSAGAASRAWVARVRDGVPAGWRSEIKRRLPNALADRLTSLRHTGALEWSTTRAFPLVADLQGYIRVNLRGRESAGIVEPGSEYDEVCARLVEGLSTFVDADSNEPVVEAVRRIDELYPDGPRRSMLPDLVVRWAPVEAAHSREIRSPRFGSIACPTPGLDPGGRSGNHRPEGFLLATGTVAPTALPAPRHILDLAPTVFELLGVERPPRMPGTPLWTRPVECARQDSNL